MRVTMNSMILTFLALLPTSVIQGLILSFVRNMRAPIAAVPKAAKIYTINFARKLSTPKLREASSESLIAVNAKPWRDRRSKYITTMTATTTANATQ